MRYLFLLLALFGCQKNEDCEVPNSIWDEYQVIQIWGQYGKGKGVRVLIDEMNFDLSSGLKYNKDLSKDLKGLDFQLVGLGDEHGTQMWSVLLQVAPEVDVILCRREGSMPHSYIKTLRYADEVDADIIVSAVQLPFYSDLLQDWYDRTNRKIFYASPPAIENNYGGMYNHQAVTVVGTKIKGQITVESKQSIVDTLIPAYHIYTGSEQVYGTSPATFVVAGLEACKMTK